MRNSQKKIIFLTIFGLLLSIQPIRSQTANEIEIYNWFDKNLSIESLDIKNGLAHLNFDNTVNDQDRYYLPDFKNGSVNYNLLNYFDLFLKYDIYSDELVLRPYDELNTTKINLIKDNISYFKIGTEKFINLKELNSTIFKGGFYEEVLIGNNITLYIKYYKERKKVTKDNVDLIEYVPKYEFILLKENKFNLINDKKVIIALFPANKKKINDFYDMNKNLKESNTPLFMENLVKYINN
ncbi:hypothetical protein IR010_16035 [Flavobacterium sp. MR2016-29]|uniref:hypothetical protein n=1 Tax=Flavobacterium sp. MR2016-29 TaxID=2783795 RepID=UPI00188C2E08|nr:hypothetical protein [Flavobacterium sp. MR2016-29]MBF4494060.1 hypothetical protein [Flavobacterium sp. MR2016-29]